MEYLCDPCLGKYSIGKSQDTNNIHKNDNNLSFSKNKNLCSSKHCREGKQATELESLLTMYVSRILLYKELHKSTTTKR